MLDLCSAKGAIPFLGILIEIISEVEGSIARFDWTPPGFKSWVNVATIGKGMP